jgi:phosphomannomutase/phosphoglucomutase
MEIFKKYDIRGIYPSELNEEKAFRIGRAIATRLHGKKFFVNYDNRFGSMKIKQEFTNGLLRSGATVYELGMGPLTVPAFASFAEKACGICISASHNPKEYTGIITYLNGTTLTPRGVEKTFKENKPLNKFGTLIPFNYDEEYMNYVTKGIEKLELKIGVDSLGGATTYIAPLTLQKAGARAFPLRTVPSEDFYGKNPDPSKENAKELSNLIKKENLDFGVQLDADGDRALIVDDKGNALDPMVTSMILIKYLKLKKVVATIACSSVLEKYAKIKYVKTGRPYVEAEIKKGKYDFGVETMMHFSFGKYYPFSDGILTALLIGKVIKLTGKNLSEIIKEFPKIYYGNISLNFDSQEKINKKMRVITEKLKSYKNKTKTDGVKITFDDGFMLFRPSNTEPVIRVYYDGLTPSAFKRIGNIVKSIIK